MASAAPAAPIPGNDPIPLATGDYASAAATANAAYNTALAQINSQRQNALQQFGYQGTIDPATGTIKDMQVDPNNPYGQFQTMLRDHALAQQGIQAADMSRGIGPMAGPRGGGLAAQGLTADKLAFGGDSANLGSSLMGTLGDLQSQQNDAQNTMNNALWQAELGSAQNAIQGQDFNPADFTGITDQAPAGGNVPAPKTTTSASPSTPTNIGGAGKLAGRPRRVVHPGSGTRIVRGRPNRFVGAAARRRAVRNSTAAARNRRRHRG